VKQGVCGKQGKAWLFLGFLHLLCEEKSV